MSQPKPTIDDVRELHADILHLAELGLVYAFPSHDPLDPLILASKHCPAALRATAIPLHELQQTFRTEERLAVASSN